MGETNIQKLLDDCTISVAEAGETLSSAPDDKFQEAEEHFFAVLIEASKKLYEAGKLQEGMKYLSNAVSPILISRPPYLDNIEFLKELLASYVNAGFEEASYLLGEIQEMEAL